MQKLRKVLQIIGTALVLFTLFGFLPYNIGLPLAIMFSLILDLTYVIEYYRNGEVQNARRHIYYMIAFLGLILFMLM